jgi:hypothetical protein
MQQLSLFPPLVQLNHGRIQGPLPEDAPVIVSNGVGVNSMAMLVLLPQLGITPDAVVTALVGRGRFGNEPRRFYDYLPNLDAWLTAAGFPAPAFSATRVHLKRIAGVDLVAVDGISASLAQMILAEAGSDMSQFPNEKHFCSWLSLAPKNDISGKILKSRTLKSRNRAGQAFRLAAAAVVRADCAFGAFYRRLKSRLGPAQAIVATAHKIARVVYRMLKYKIEYEHIAAEQYDQKFKEREIQYMQRKAARLGFALSPASPPVTPPVAGAVS